jgi:hypothetical protein
MQRHPLIRWMMFDRLQTCPDKREALSRDYINYKVGYIIIVQCTWHFFFLQPNSYSTYKVTSHTNALRIEESVIASMIQNKVRPKTVE